MFVTPQAAFAQAETLCDGVDNDMDGTVDDGFDVGAACNLSSTNAFGTCQTQGHKICKADNTGTVCAAVDATLMNAIELNVATEEALVAGSLSCFDGVDNDCDGFADTAGALIEGVPVGADTACVTAVEVLCNGFDDNADGLIDNMPGSAVGDACNVGVGQCANTGEFICDPSDATQASVKCTVTPGIPQMENTPGKLRCTDGLDNDCDGSIDILDADCQTAEICDGIDNDGDLSVDEGFTLGSACSVGVGACQSAGVTTCNAAGTATQCNVAALPPGAEGPSGLTCGDGKDNDCDGLVDNLDPDCNSAAVFVQCSLESLKKNPKDAPGTSCEEKFRLNIAHTNLAAFPGAELTAELKLLNPDGTPVNITPFPSAIPVAKGDEIHFNSRLDPASWKLVRAGRFVDAFGPVPIVEVTLNTGQNEVTAYCSHIPYLNVVKPSGSDQVVSASEGDTVDVVVPMPRVNPATIGIVVDGVNILNQLGVNPATYPFPNPGNPVNGTVMINGKSVEVINLVVNVASNLTVLGRNSLTMQLKGLGGGGHIVVVNGDPFANAVPPPNSAQCHVDDVLDDGTVSVFGITINDPTENEEVPSGPTTVDATISHGRAIASANVQGMDTPVTGQTCSNLEFVAFGQTYSVESCGVDISKQLEQADLSAPLEIGTIAKGQNKITVGAQDDLLNRTFAQRRFTSGIGSTIPPTTLALSPQQMALAEEALEQQLGKAFDKSEGLKPLSIDVKAAGEDLTIDLAFTFGVSESGVNDFFQASCDQVKADVETKVDEALSAAQFDPVSVPVDGGCDPTVQITGLDVGLVGPLECDVDPEQDLMTVTVTLPDIDFTISAEGRCKDTFLGVCISEVIVSGTAHADIDDFGFSFGLTEDLVLQGGPSENPLSITGTVGIPPPDIDIELNCFTGFLADVVNFFTFGLVDFEEDVAEAVEGAFGDGITVDIAEAIRSNHPDPLEVQKIEVNEQLIEADGIETEQEVLSIQITEGGFTGTIGASFTIAVPEGEDFEAVINSPAAPEYEDVTNAKELFFAATDDIFNLLFAAIGLQGALTTECTPTPLELGDTLPVNCNSLVGPDAGATDIMRGRCHGAKGIDCTTLPLFGEFFWCQNTKDIFTAQNIDVTTPLLFCGNGSIAPRTLIKDNAATVNAVEAELYENDFQITIALDRNRDGQFDPDAFFPLAQGCLALGEDPTRDCRWSDACFDLNLATEFTLGGGGSNSQIVRTVTGVSDSVGFECAGGFNLGTGNVVLTEAGASDPVTTIQENIQNIVGIFEALGLELGDLVTLQNRNIISIDVPGAPDDCSNCAEYVGVTGDFAP